MHKWWCYIMRHPSVLAAKSQWLQLWETNELKPHRQTFRTACRVASGSGIDRLLGSALVKLPGTYFNLVNCCVYLPCLSKWDATWLYKFRQCWRSDSPCLLCRVGARDELLVSLAASTMARVDEVCLATRACSYIHLAPTDGLPSG